MSCNLAILPSVNICKVIITADTWDWAGQTETRVMMVILFPAVSAVMRSPHRCSVTRCLPEI